MNIKQEGETDFIDGALIWILSPQPAFGGHRFLSLIIIHNTDLKGAHPTLPTFRMKVM